jgi:hypothetical protein
MDGAGPQHPLSDSQLDCELESALGIEPSPGFLARVRTRITAEPEVLPRRLAVMSAFRRPGRRWSVEPLWAVAIAGIVLAIVVPRWIRDGKPTVTITDRRPIERPPISDGSNNEAAAIGGGMDRVGVTATVATRSVSRIQKRLHGTPEVLISQDDQRAFDALLIAVAENRLLVRATPVEEAGSSLAIVPLQIQQLRIEPLQLTGLEGVNGS